MTANEYLKYERWLEKPVCQTGYIARVLAELDPYDANMDYSKAKRITENENYIEEAIEKGLLTIDQYIDDSDDFFDDQLNPNAPKYTHIIPLLGTLKTIQWLIADDKLTIPDMAKKWAEKQIVDYGLYVGSGITWSKNECLRLLSGLNPNTKYYTKEQCRKIGAIDFLMEHGKKTGGIDPARNNKKIVEPFYQYTILARFDPLAAIKWALRTGLIDVPKPLVDWCKKQSDIPHDDKQKQSKVIHLQSQTKQQQREAVLSEVITEYKAINTNIDGVYSRDEIWGKCLKKSNLFNVGEDARNKFFNTQSLIKPREAGRPTKI